MKIPKIDTKKTFSFIKDNWLIIAIVGLVLWFFTPIGGTIRNLIAKAKANVATQEYQNSKIVVNTPPKETYNLQQVADVIYKAFHQTGWFNASEDEELAIDTIKSIPQPYVSQVASLYAKKGYNMYDDFVKYLSDSEYARVEAWLK